MYDEGADAGGGVAPAIGGAVKRFNLEGLIPLILLVVIGVASLNYFGVIDIPYLPKGSQRVQVMFVGEPSLGERVVLDNLSSFLAYRQRNADSFGNASSEELHQYDIVILDQSNVANKSVSVALGEAIQKYVEKGGKLIVVLDSGIYQSVGFQGYTASDVVGWKATFGNIIPADCVAGKDGVPSCRTPESVVGRVWQQDFDHPIMRGIETAPPMGDAPKGFKVLPIQPDAGANQIAYIKSENTPKTYFGILEKKQLFLGKVIYFNYDPGMTPGILNNTINYLLGR
jgi:hypothetical protein